jgi:hypothetical protein
MTPRKAFGVVLVIGVLAVAATSLLLDGDAAIGHAGPLSQVAPWLPMRTR